MFDQCIAVLMMRIEEGHWAERRSEQKSWGWRTHNASASKNIQKKDGTASKSVAKTSMVVERRPDVGGGCSQEVLEFWLDGAWMDRREL